MPNVETLRREGFAETVRTWLEENVPHRWRTERGALSEDESDEIRHEWDRQLFRGGLAGLSLPKEFGGQGLGVAEEVIFADLAGRAQAPDGLARIGRILTAPTLISHGTQYQLERYLPRILSGDEIWCQGFSEPDAGSDLAGVRCNAVKVDGGYRVTGRKIWTSFARLADRCLLLAQTDPAAPRHKNLTMFLLDMKQPGISISPIRQASGISHFAEVQFENVFVADDDRVANDGDGWKVAMTVLANERGGVEAASRYVELRADMDLLSQSIGHLPEYQRQLAELDTRVELIRWQTLKSIDFDPQSTVFFRSAAILKVSWSELLQEIAALGIETMNADTADHWRFQYLETRAASIYSGSNEIQRNIIAERILGLPR
ncbi:acyl-CoA dehydrogenase [Cryobacterium sp. TMS1-20-1]|uniref:acyl-CoA dehydrogenase family protein n=1 Tax=Cryobacterium sp. TMS1-20-1 TaxID=1259223 RepID=UPI0010692CEC|nr:acyl-CoA dehydrogenase family protein [Cryobacterium sp. TMS1-20-1]TFC80547.1 acyl-CoA dehydrogenase [Cryobacterium sp. TMS1-20-1]